MTPLLAHTTCESKYLAIHHTLSLFAKALGFSGFWSGTDGGCRRIFKAVAQFIFSWEIPFKLSP